MEIITLNFQDNDHDFELSILESKTIIPQRQTVPTPIGFWGYWTVRKAGKIVAGLPVQDEHGKIKTFKTPDEAIVEAKIFMGF